MNQTKTRKRVVGNPEAVSVFMERSLADLEDMEGRTPLMWAAATGNLANLPFLSRHGEGHR
jgi:hypothetical protein